MASRPSRKTTTARPRGPLANPFIAAASAALLVVGGAAGLIAVLGDPNAGVPQVRVRLTGIGHQSPPGWKEALLQATPKGGVSSGALDFDSQHGAQAAAQSVPATLVALPKAPIAGMTEPGPGGSLLPIVAADGRTPAVVYARPFASNGKPKVAIIVGGLGLNPRYTQQAIEQLPPEVTLSFAPNRDNLQAWIDQARARGHEVLIEAPMEPKDYPDNDPGPFTLLAGSSPAETSKRTEWILSRASGYFGVINAQGSRFVTADAPMGAFLQTLKSRGLAFIDDGSARARGGGLPRGTADAAVDDELSGEAIDKRLGELETLAGRHGQAMGSAFAYPVTLSKVAQWAQGLQQRGVQLAPASALMIRR